MSDATNKPNPNGFTDPFFHMAKSEKTRTTIDVATSARAKIAAVYPKKGYLQTTINILINKLAAELKRCGLETYDPERYELAISGCHVLLGGYTYVILSNGHPRLVLCSGDPPPTVTPNAIVGVPPGPAPKRGKPRKSTQAAG